MQALSAKRVHSRTIKYYSNADCTQGLIVVPRETHTAVMAMLLRPQGAHPQVGECTKTHQWIVSWELKEPEAERARQREAVRRAREA